MNSRFKVEIFKTQPFFFEEGEEGERDRPVRHGRVASRRSGARGQAPARRRPTARPRLQFPVRFPVFPLPYPSWPGLQPDPVKEPDAQEPPIGFAPDDAPASQLETGQGGGGRKYVRRAQSRLNQLLGLRLPLDGEMGVKTRAAIRSLQRKYGLPVDGCHPWNDLRIDALYSKPRNSCVW